MLNMINRVLGRLTPPPLVTPPPVALIQERLRNAFRHYLKGNGIEVGALHFPLPVSDLPISSIKYVDRLTVAELKRHYPELGPVPLVTVDIVDDGEVLGKIENTSLDFIIGNHFIEHTRNPIATLDNWLQKLKPAGHIFMAVPDKRYTFDVARTLTPLAHLVADYPVSREHRVAQDRGHFVEWATFVDKLSPPEIEARVDFLVNMDYSIHFHTFTLQSFLPIVNYMQKELQAPLALTACADTVEGSNEFLVVLSRI